MVVVVVVVAVAEGLVFAQTVPAVAGAGTASSGRRCLASFTRELFVQTGGSLPD